MIIKFLYPRKCPGWHNLGDVKLDDNRHFSIICGTEDLTKYKNSKLFQAFGGFFNLDKLGEITHTGMGNSI